MKNAYGVLLYRKRQRKGRGFSILIFKVLRECFDTFKLSSMHSLNTIDNPLCGCYQRICLLFCQFFAIL